MNTKSKIIIMAPLILLLVMLDQFSKKLAILYLAGQSAINFFGGHFQLVYSVNTGAFLGMGGELSREVRFIVFTLIVFIGLGGMLWYLLKNEKSKLNLIAYTFILAGGIGNLLDRTFNTNGHVVDFLFIEIIGPLRTGIFNIADVEIMIGMLLILLKEYYLKKKLAKEL